MTFRELSTGIRVALADAADAFDFARCLGECRIRL